MGIKITEDGVVNYDNQPDINRELFPNLNGCCAELRTEIGELKESVSDLNGAIDGYKIINYVEGKNIDANGDLVDDPTKCVSEKIPYTWTGSTRYYYGEQSADYRIAFYGSDDSYLVSRISNNNAIYRSLDVSTLTESPVAYVRFSFKKDYAGKAVKNANPEPAPYWTATETAVAGLTSKVETLEETKLTVYGLEYKTSAVELTTGTTLAVASNIDSRKHDVIEFRGDISNFTSVTVGHGYQINHGMWVTVDDTNITTYDDEDSEQVAQQPHGLTFSHFINVMIVRGDNNRALIEITTDGGMYRWENVAWSGNRGSVFAFCTGTLTDAKLTSVFRDFNAPIFMFGDSYQSIGDSARYPYYLVQNGFTNFLAAGFPGASALHGIEAFRAIIAHATPKYVVWALGMNGSDSADAVNTYWKDATDEVIATCASKNITLILATVPNVPERIQTFKNDYVRNSGKRYIDFAKAVGAEQLGATWYTGMLSSDNLHPTALGAQALYAQLLADFPEIIR